MTSTTEAPPVERVYPPKLMFMVVNPLMTWALNTGFGKKVEGLARLEFKGRKSGKDYKLVSALQEVGDRVGVLTNSGWRWNFENGYPVTVITGGERKEMTGTLEADPEEVARIYGHRIEELGVDMAARRLGVKINVDRTPSHDELTDLAKKEGLSVIFLSE